MQNRALKFGFAFSLLAVSLVHPYSHVYAQSFPTKPVRMIVGYPAGGPLDVIARGLAEGLSERWKQPVVVENRVGAGEILAAGAVARAVPDGYTLLSGSGSAFSTNIFTRKNLPYDPEKDLAPIAHLTVAAMALVVPASMPVKTLQDFVDLAKREPGKLTYGSAGTLSPPQFSHAELRRYAGVELRLVPFQGIGPVLTEMLGGRIDSAIGGLSAVVPMVNDGKIRALAVGGNRRAKDLPDVPTFQELGLGGIDPTFFAGLAAPAGTPKPIIDQIAGDVRIVTSAPEFIAKYIDPFGMVLAVDTPESFRQFLVQQRKRDERRIKEAGIEPQ